MYIAKEISDTHLINSKNQKSKNIVLYTNTWGQWEVSWFILGELEYNFKERYYTYIKFRVSNMLFKPSINPKLKERQQ